MKHLKTSLILLVFLFTTEAFAYGTFLNSSSLLSGKEYDISGVGQFFSGDRRGTHAMGIVDLPFTKQTNLRFNAGIGSLDLSLGGALKWVPVRTNSRNILNIGGVFSAEYGRDSGFDAFLFRASPFVSKAFSWEHGALEPYVAVPFGVAAVDSESDFVVQFIAGTKIKFDSLSYMHFSAEGGFDVKNADSYFALMATVLLRK